MSDVVLTPELDQVQSYHEDCLWDFVSVLYLYLMGFKLVWLEAFINFEGRPRIFRVTGENTQTCLVSDEKAERRVLIQQLRLQLILYTQRALALNLRSGEEE